MMLIEILLNTLLTMKLCQSFRIHQTHKDIRNVEKYSGFSHIKPFSLGSPNTTLDPKVSIRLQAPSSYHIIPAQHRLNNAWLPKSPNSNMNVQPVTAEFDKNKNHFRNEPLNINYHNKIYQRSTIKRASPLANNEQENPQKFIVRKQKNFNRNHDDKLIEQNIEEIANVDEDNYQQNTEAASIKPPLKQLSRPTNETSHEIRYLHDIFLNYPKSHHVNFGHIELSPVLFEKHFESQKAGNRYKGEIMWLDNTGSFAQHSWDLAQGSL